ncbi:hypothetical protein Fot_14572 [Forsythia ovata]|uniref:Uncharacterized protein n=1 Tax=Forsythia ovata TaxID=205694 RepID=A0ABD1W6P4_9LAMI
MNGYRWIKFCRRYTNVINESCKGNNGHRGEGLFLDIIQITRCKAGDYYRIIKRMDLKQTRENPAIGAGYNSTILNLMIPHLLYNTGFFDGKNIPEKEALKPLVVKLVPKLPQQKNEKLSNSNRKYEEECNADNTRTKGMPHEFRTAIFATL